MVRYLSSIVIMSFLFGAFGDRLNATETGFEQIFDGETLQGWHGDPKLWSVQNNAITGVTTDEQPLQYNKFLIWDGEVENFHLRAKVRLIGNSNSGIQYRSAHLEDQGEFVVGGYQCDIHPKGENNGMLYHERGRGIVAKHGQKVIVDQAGGKWITGTTGPIQAVDLADWNTFEIIAVGNKLLHKLNGEICAEIIDHHEDGRLLKGVIAFQVHRGPAMRVQVKDIELKRLPAGGMLSLTDAPIPADAEKVSGRKPQQRTAKKNAPRKSKSSSNTDVNSNSVSRSRKSDIFRETFDQLDTTHFLTKIPNGNSEVREGVLWTHGESGGKYPPIIALNVEGKDLEISFRYRHLEPGGMIWFFIDGDDGFGSVDHMLRTKLLENGIDLQIDAHSLNSNHPDRHNKSRPADKVSGAYRLNYRFPREQVNLPPEQWHGVKLAFAGDTVEISVDRQTWRKTLKHPCFDANKRKLLWMLKGGQRGVEIDDVVVSQN